MARASLLLGAVAAACALLAAPGWAGCEADVVRVGLRFGAGAASSVVVGRARWRGERGEGDLEGATAVTLRGEEVALPVGGQEPAEGGAGRWLELSPAAGEQWVELDGRAYRGRLRLEAQPDSGGLRVVNEVALEEYLRGVVPSEMFPDPEAYRVQAVVSRTLALYFRDVERRHAAEGFDLCPTGHCQVYGGVDAERLDSDEAVEATRGEVLTYDGRPIFSAYHANAGGMTEGVAEAWPGSVAANFPYLRPVESPQDAAARSLPGYEWCWQWQRIVSRAEVARRLEARGQGVGEVQELVVRARTGARRVKRLEVVGSQGRLEVVGTDAVLEVLGAPSALFELARAEGGWKLRGRGHGHGVGLSQHGALGMARAGRSYREILAHYYQGAGLERAAAQRDG